MSESLKMQSGHGEKHLPHFIGCIDDAWHVFRRASSPPLPKQDSGMFPISGFFKSQSLVICKIKPFDVDLMR